MLSNNIEKHRKRLPFFKFGLGKDMLTILKILFGGRQTEIRFRIVHFYCLKCFRIILKSIGNAGLFSNFVIFVNVPMRANLASLQGRRQSLNSFLPHNAEYAQKIRYDTIRYDLCFLLF